MLQRRLPTDDSRERGQVVMLVAVMMLVLLGVSAMALDVGQIMWSREAQQNAADAAALGGVKALPDSPPLARQVALQYGTDNGFTNGAGGVTVTPRILHISDTGNEESCDDTRTDCNAIEVTITRNVPPGLRAAVGGGNINVPAQAVAIVAPAVPTCDIWPWGIEEDAMLYQPYHDSGTIVLKPYYQTFGEKVMLKVPPRDSVAPGNFLALRPGTSSGTSDYRNNIKYGACITNFDEIETEPGNMGNNTARAVLDDSDSAIKQCDPCYNPATQLPDSIYWRVNDSTPYTSSFIDPSTGMPYTTTRPFALGCPCGNACGNTGPPSASDPFPDIVVPSTSRVGIVPILEAGTFANARAAHGSFTAHIVGFAGFYLIGIESDGSQDFVVGAFLDKVVVKAGKPDFGGDLNGTVGYYLWR